MATDFGEGGEVIAAFEDRDEAAAGVTVGNGQQLLGQPDEVLGLDVELRQRIAAMGIEARRHDDEFGGETVEGRQEALAPGRPEFRRCRFRRPAARSPTLPAMPRSRGEPVPG